MGFKFFFRSNKVRESCTSNIRSTSLCFEYVFWVLWLFITFHKSLDLIVITNIIFSSSLCFSLPLIIFLKIRHYWISKSIFCNFGLTIFRILCFSRGSHYCMSSPMILLTNRIITVIILKLSLLFLQCTFDRTVYWIQESLGSHPQSLTLFWCLSVRSFISSYWGNLGRWGYSTLSDIKMVNSCCKIASIWRFLVVKSFVIAKILKVKRRDILRSIIEQTPSNSIFPFKWSCDFYQWWFCHSLVWTPRKRVQNLNLQK